MTAYSHRGIELPAHLQDSIEAYVNEGRPLGSFLAAVVNNNLREAFNRADEDSTKAMSAIVAYFYNRTPMACWGYDGAYEKWLEKKREERVRELNRKAAEGQS